MQINMPVGHTGAGLACQRTNFGAMGTRVCHYSETNGEKNWIVRLLHKPLISGKIAFIRLILFTK